MSNNNHAFDTEKLASYLEKNMPGFQGPLTAEKFSGGQSNPTFLITAESGQYVLRRQPPGKLLKSAHAVDREFKVMVALSDTDVPVPKAYFLCEDKDVIGSMFYLMSYEEGQIYWSPHFPELDKSQRRHYFEELVRVLAAIHNVDINAVGLGDYGRPGNYFERQINMWTKQYRSSEIDTIEAMETLIEWLPAHCPEDDGQPSLVHGDYRLDNLIFANNEAKAIAVLDWELSTLGNPLADLAYFCMCHRLPPDSRVAGFAGVDRSTLGIPEEHELIAQYCRLRGIDNIENWHFYLAFSFFRLAAITQGVAKRALDGNASSVNATEAGKIAPLLASMALAVIEEEG